MRGQLLAREALQVRAGLVANAPRAAYRAGGAGPPVVVTE